MKYAIYNAAGDILRTGHCPDGEEPNQAHDGEAVFIGDATFQDLIDPTDGTLIPGGKGVQPSPDYDWSDATRAWVGNIDRARAGKKALIELERDGRSVAPVLVYDSINLDADMRAIENLKSKLAELDSRDALGQSLTADQCVWRDADNGMHQWPDQASYKAWLQGFAVALGTRGTDAYAWSWQKKAQLDALTTFDDVVAFDAIS